MTKVTCGDCAHADWTPEHDEVIGGACQAPVGPKMPMNIEIRRHKIHPDVTHQCHAFEAGDGIRVDLARRQCRACSVPAEMMMGGRFYCHTCWALAVPRRSIENRLTQAINDHVARTGGHGNMWNIYLGRKELVELEQWAADTAYVPHPKAASEKRREYYGALVFVVDADHHLNVG